LLSAMYVFLFFGIRLCRFIKILRSLESEDTLSAVVRQSKYLMDLIQICFDH
jgi:hypothetical protein